MTGHPHLRVAATALINIGGWYREWYLILQRQSNDPYKPDEWDIPGGEVDPGESAQQALMREVYEETGLTIEVKSPRYVFSNVPDGWLVIVYECDLGKDSPPTAVKLSTEHQKYEWVDVHTLCERGVTGTFALNTVAQIFSGKKEKYSDRV